jgi:hypothetical protein
LVKTKKQLFINPAHKLLVGVFVAVLISGCTSSRDEDFSASSTHAGIVPPPVSNDKSSLVIADQQPTRENVQADNRFRNDTMAPNKVVNHPNVIVRQPNPRVTNFYSPVNRSGVVYQENEAQQVKLQPKSQNNSADLLGQSQMASRVASLRNLSPNVFSNKKEQAALKRIQILDARIKHSSCKGGWATQPDKLDASETTAGHPFYMEMRMRHTPMLPVGHTYIAYGRLSPSGKPLEERLIMLSPIGGYGGAAIAAALPMPGVLKPVADDCRVKPIAAYRVTLSAVEYEKLLLRIHQARSKSPAYALFAYNCNHFASDIAAAVGILPPKNKYLPALKYIFGVIEANKNFASRRKYRT